MGKLGKKDEKAVNKSTIGKAKWDTHKRGK